MKVIFLDIDGVLNAADDEYITTGPRKGKKAATPPRVCGYMGISNKKVERLARIVKATDAKIVLVSTWKKSYDRYMKVVLGEAHLEDISPTHYHIGKYLHNKLSSQGLQIYDTTILYDNYFDHAHIGLRGEGIKKWLAAHETDNITNWIAIDDELFGYREDQHDNLIITSSCFSHPYSFYLKASPVVFRHNIKSKEFPQLGLTDDLVEEAIQKLNKEATQPNEQS